MVYMIGRGRRGIMGRMGSIKLGIDIMGENRRGGVLGGGVFV
jgi:hypothetical protein